MVDRKPSIRRETGRAPAAPANIAGQPRALMGNAKPDAGSTAASAPARKLLNRVPLESRQKAFNAFRTFSLSRFSAENVPPNYLTGDSAKDPAAIAEMQKKVIENSLAQAKDLDTDNAGMAISCPADKF